MNFFQLLTYFREIGLLDPRDKIYLKRLAFLYWCFSECLTSRTVFVINRVVSLQPFEFIGCKSKNRDSGQCGLTENEFKAQVKTFFKAGLLQKTDNSIHSRFSCYRWNLDLIERDREFREAEKDFEEF